MTSIDVVVMYPFDIFSLVKKSIFHKGIIRKRAIILQYIIYTYHFGICCCLTVHRYVRCVQIMRLTNLGHGTFWI